MDFLRASRCFNVQSAASANPFWTFSVLPAASTSNLPLLQIPFGLLPCFPLLQRPIRRSFSLLLDFLLPSRRFNVQSSASANPFWTSSRLSAASTSNLPLLQIPFRLPPAFPSLQRPILRSFSLLLDFLRASRCFNVQSAALSHSFWTFSVLPAASTSNLPLFLTPFGLPLCFPPLQRPIRRSFSLLLDFLLPSRRFNVQSAASANPFWTSSCLPAASTHAFVVYEYFINYYLTLISEYFIFLL